MKFKFKIEAGSRVTMYLPRTIVIEAEDSEEAKDLAVDHMLELGEVSDTDIHVVEVA